MRILLMASVACSLALAGCGGGTKNSSATNNSTSVNTGATATNSSAPAAGGSNLRATFMAECEQRGRATQGVPADFDFTGACGCAYDRALADKPDPQAFSTNPQARTVIAEALATCIREQVRAAGASPSAGAEEAGEEAAEEEGTEEK